MVLLRCKHISTAITKHLSPYATHGFSPATTHRIPSSATNSLLPYHATRRVLPATSTLAVFQFPPAAKTPSTVMTYCSKAQKEGESGKTKKLLAKILVTWKNVRNNMKLYFTRDGIGASYDDGEKKGKGRIWRAGRRLLGDLKAQMGDFYAEIGFGKKKSAFRVARLARHSRYYDEEHITILEEDLTGLTYMVCMAGVRIKNVRIYTKGRWMRIRGTPPGNKQWGPKERVIDLMLPKPDGDGYKDGDYEVTWYYNQAIIKISMTKCVCINVK